eukprot:CAMPEP_0197050714 /NCGR_PEP_ID=MMETSP1384-20130603/25553_1 /TAXON_ID=29189 /ORGANISM="Ammonia sp." /LENGTH=87 /DNA_ID=CAMNT_0042483163 /DNA_START=415 /DNA_END=678 /DNA_ORIENTATION=+
MHAIARFRRLPYVLPIAKRIDKNVLWFVRKTVANCTNDSVDGEDAHNADCNSLQRESRTLVHHKAVKHEEEEDGNDSDRSIETFEIE